MPIKYIPFRGKTSYKFGGGDDDVRVSFAGDTTDYVVDLGGGADYAELGAGHDVVMGGKGGDRLFGGQGNDIIFGGIPDGSFSPRTGYDELISGDAHQALVEAEYVFGNDTLYGETGSRFVFAEMYGDNTGAVGGVLQCGDDVISGGGGGNFLFGDALELGGAALGGDDALSVEGDCAGGAIYGDAFTLIEGARGGDDVVVITQIASRYEVFGDAWQMKGDTFGGDDRLEGTNSTVARSLLWGDAYGIEASGSSTVTCGDDVLVAHGSDTRMVGDASRAYFLLDHTGAVILFGNDELNARSQFSSSSTSMWGDAELISAASGSTTICGDDILNGGLGQDIMWGDYEALEADGGTVTRGADTFLFDAYGLGGADVIGDFEQGNDLIVIYYFAGLLLFTAATSTTTDDSTLITLFGNDSWSLLVVGVPGLTRADVYA